MAHPLDGARLKIVRAEEQLQSLKDEIVRYLDSKPYEFPVEDHGDAVVTTNAVIKQVPPLRLGCIFGECLGSLRASLDYVAWELASRYATVKPVVRKNRDISFPIFRAAGDGANSLAKLANKYAFPAASIALIESVQPYNAGYEIVGFLSDFVCTDKHCVPLMTLATANTTWIQFQHPDGAATIGSRRGPVVIRRLRPGDFDENFRPTEQSTRRDRELVEQILAKAGDTSRPSPFAQPARTVKVEGQVTVFVSLKDSPLPNEPAERKLEQVVKCVAGIVPRFEQFF